MYGTERFFAVGRPPTEDVSKLAEFTTPAGTGDIVGIGKGGRIEWHCRFGGKGLGQAAALSSC
jgi:hypothetical protein